MGGDVHLDFETRSRVDLNVVGAARYAIDPSTEILMCGVSEAPLDAPVFLWVNPKYFTADELGENAAAEELLARAERYHAHNCPFEHAIVWGAAERGAASPFKQPPPITAWRDSAAVSRKAGLPWALDKLGAALNLSTQKDAKGKALIRFFCEPNKKGEFNEPWDFPEKWIAFCSYCRTDVRSEKQASHKLKPFELQGATLESFLFDLRLNHRGIPVNVQALTNAQRIIDTVQARVTKEFVTLTSVNPTQREEVRKLVGLPNMQAEVVKAALDGQMAPLTEKQRRILQLYQKLSFAAVKKVRTMLDCVCPDGVVRGGHLWYGTGPGRHSGRLIQPQNFRKTDPEMRHLTKEVYALIERGWTADELTAVYDDPYKLLANCIRHFIHCPGTPMLDGDYSAIQARVICWLAGQQDALQRYREGKDTYKWMAARIYHVPESQITADQREVGKRVVLGAGFQMGPAKFRSSCLEQYGLDLPLTLCEKGIAAFRETHDRVKAFWYELDRNAKSAVKLPGTRQGRFIVKTVAGMPYLLMSLPSGRSIAYPRPEISKEKVATYFAKDFTEEEFAKSDASTVEREQLTYWGALPQSVHWGRVKLYGGKLAENMTMGVEADIMNHGLINAEKAGMPPFMLVHDQALALQLNGKTPEQFGAALLDLPPWAAGLPVKADVKSCLFYAK